MVIPNAFAVRGYDYDHALTFEQLFLYPESLSDQDRCAFCMFFIYLYFI